MILHKMGPLSKLLAHSRNFDCRVIFVYFAKTARILYISHKLVSNNRHGITLMFTIIFSYFPPVSSFSLFSVHPCCEVHFLQSAVNKNEERLITLAYTILWITATDRFEKTRVNISPFFPPRSSKKFNPSLLLKKLGLEQNSL